MTPEFASAPRSRLGVRLVVASTSVLVAFSLLELALRIGGFRHNVEGAAPITWQADSNEPDQQSFHRAAPRQLWEPVPGALLPWGDEERVNAAGYRGPELAREKTPGVLRIATLGDSSTFGFGLGYDETWSAQLVRELAARGVAAEVLDAGVIGSTIEQGLERYDELVRTYRPDVVITAFGAVNEAFDSNAGSDREKIESRARALAPRSLLGSAQRDLRTLQLAAWLVDGASDGLSKAEQRKARKLKRALQRDQEIGRLEWLGTRRVTAERFEVCLAEFDRRVREDGARLVFVSMPREPRHEETWPVLAGYSEALARAAPRLGVPLYDFRGSVARELAAGRQWNELFLDACHPSVTGNRLLAHELADVVAGPATPK